AYAETPDSNSPTTMTMAPRVIVVPPQSLQRLVHRVDELVRHSVNAVEVQRRLRGVDLLQRHALLLQIEDAVADDDHHVPVDGDVGGVAQPAMTGHNHRTALMSVLGEGDVDDLVQRVDFALHRAAPGD